MILYEPIYGMPQKLKIENYSSRTIADEAQLVILKFGLTLLATVQCHKIKTKNEYFNRQSSFIKDKVNHNILRLANLLTNW